MSNDNQPAKVGSSEGLGPLLDRLRTDVLWHQRRGNDTIAQDCADAAEAIHRLSMDLENTRAEAAMAVQLERERAKVLTGKFAQRWWSKHCASNKHMETTREAHDDFCKLQGAIGRGDWA